MGITVTNRQDVLNLAGSYIQTDRNSTYGEPEDNFRSIARLWMGYMFTRYGIELDIATYDVANLMILMKMARAANDPTGNMDNYVDTVGYAACAAECVALEAAKPIVYSPMTGAATSNTYIDEVTPPRYENNPILRHILTAATEERDDT
jgi:hypothetical protein